MTLHAPRSRMRLSAQISMAGMKTTNPARQNQTPKGSSYTNKNFCYVCGKGYSKLARHLSRHVDEEPLIAEALAFPKYSKERQKLLLDLRNRGNYKHNQEVLRNNSGELKLKRRPQTLTASAHTHMHCLYCKAMMKRKEMHRHVARCHARTISKSAAEGKARVFGESALAESLFSQKLPSAVRKMLLPMRHDKISFTVQRDFLLMKLAQNLLEKCRNDPNKHEYIRKKLREMGRLLIALHEKSVFSFEEAIKPQNFYKVVEAIKDIAGFDEEMQSYHKPSLALKLGRSLKKIGTIVLTGRDGNEQMMRDTKTFMKLCAKEWSEFIPQKAIASLSGQKVNNPSTIPLTCDLQVFYKYLETSSASATEALNMHESPQAYQALCKVTLTQVSVLNKCAPEVSKMTLKTFQESGDTTKVLSKHFIRINILSRMGQNVAVLLTSELVSAITLLVSKRQACGVHQDNPFLFAKPNSSSTSIFHGHICIRAFSSLCCAKSPEHLRSVHLRKHIARVFQILSLENDELCHLAKLLGHDIRADRDYYQLPEAAVELAKIAKLVVAMEKGCLERFKGNSLEEIEIEDEFEPDVEHDSPESGDDEENTEESDLLPQQSDALKQPAVTEKQTRHLTPEQDALEHIKSCRDKPFLQEMFIDHIKGRGVFTHESIEPSNFVVEYRGNIFSQKDTRRRKCGDTLNNYLFDFTWNRTNWRIDASKEDGTLGRLVNDDHISPNCKMKKIVCEGKPHLCLFAVKKISPGEEITYNYGDSSYLWRSKESSEELTTSQMHLNDDESSEDENVEDSAGASSSAEACSVDEYVPDSEPSSDNSSTRNSHQSQNFDNNPEPHSSKQQNFVQQPVNASCIQQEDEADYSSDECTSDGEPEEPSRGRRNYCYVCGKTPYKIFRHLFIHRHEEPEIAELFALPLNSKERNSLRDVLRKRGNYIHNQGVVKTRCGRLKVRRRNLNMSTNAKTFAHCLYCKGLNSRKDVQRHMQKCSSNKPWKSATCGRSKDLSVVAAAESIELTEMPSDVRKLLKKKDEITSVVCNDPHIMQLAWSLSHMPKGKANQYHSITHNLRLMGRLLLTLRKKSISGFEDAVKPENFSKVVEAVRELAGFDEKLKSYHKPSVMMKLGYSLKKIGDINFARALKGDADKQTLQEAETFLKLCAKQWSHDPQSKSRINNPPTIPFIQDVQLLFKSMEETVASGVESLEMYEIPQVYTALLRVTVAQVSVLNVNKAEVSKVTLKSFNGREETELHNDAPVCQSQFDQILSKRLKKINLMSDSGKKITVALTPELLALVTLLVSKRDACGVHKNNPFLFARTVDMGFYHGSKCISTFAARCGAKNTANLRSVFFRKHVARVFQILSLTNDELDHLAKLLGRDIRTDREYYQTPEAAVDIAKIFQLLSAMKTGTLERFEGKSLEEIEIADELELDMEQDNDSDAEKDNEESESSLQPSSPSFSKGSSPTNEKVSSRKRGRRRSRRWESVKKNDEVNTEKDARSEETPESCDVNTPEKTACCSNDDAPRISLSHDDEDMDMDMDMDSDTDTAEDSETNGSAAVPLIPDGQDETKQDNDSSDTKKTNSSANKHTTPGGLEETMDNTLSAAVTRMKEVKILIPKLDIKKLQDPVYISQLSPECNSVKCPTTSTSRDRRHKKTPSYKRLVLKMVDGSETICREDCLVKFKEQIETPQLCLTCQTSHQMSDMVENENDEGRLDLFCSNRCMMLHKAKSFTASERNRPTPDESDIKEVKPSLTNLDFIKEEPIDEEYNQNLSSSISTGDIKDESNVSKEDLKISSVFSLTRDSTAPTLTHMDLPASCFVCKKVLMDGETVYQRKGHTDIYCSTTCLLKVYQINKVRKTCHFCLQALTESQDVLQAPVDTEETMKDFCSQTCLYSFNYKRIMSTKRPIMPVPSQSQCSMCSRYCMRIHEVVHENIMHKFCSDPCFLRFCTMNNLSVCENCHSHCSTPVRLKMENGSKEFCSAKCLAHFKRKIKMPHPCAMCSSSQFMSDMFEIRDNEDEVGLFCSSSCVVAFKIQTSSASGVALSCDACGKTAVPACYLTMSDASVRNFCALTCALAFKESQKAATDPTAAPDQTQWDFLKPPKKLPCAQCRRILKTAPKVVQKKGKMNFVCSLACSEEFKRVNNIMGKCEYCKSKKIIRDAKRVDNKDCYFCSDACKMLFLNELEKKWGEHCHSCAYCLSISKTVVTAQYKDSEEEFCSEDCNSNYKMLFCHIAKCETCQREGKLRQSLPMLGEVKYFCNLKCVLHFCNKKVQMGNTVSSPPRPAGTAESSPVTTNVISLAGALARQPTASASSAQHVSVPDVQTKVVGHVSVQTVPKEMKNKSVLCMPLVHNKGVSCTTQTVDTEAQTDNFVPKVIILPVPVPVPVYVPVPMNMYSQFTPEPVGLPLPLPVPVFLPVKPDGSDPSEFNFTKFEMKKTQDERNETEDRQKDRAVTKEGQRQESHPPKEQTSKCSVGFDTDHQTAFNNQEDSLRPTHTHENQPPSKPQPELPPPAPPAPPAVEATEDPQSSPSPGPAPSSSQQTVGKVHNKNKGRKLQQVSKAAEKKTWKHHRLKSQCGIDAWKRWIQWRQTQTNLGLLSSRAVTQSQDILLCSAAELSDALCCFIAEVKRRDGEPYSPDGLFYLCLSIQQYLFENGRVENIFSDLIYSRFSTEFTRILKAFKPSVSASYIHSRVEEEFLWDCKQLGAYSPIVLLNTLLFFCCKYFGFTTVEQHRQLSFAHVMRCTKTNQNNTRTTFLRFYPPISINEAESEVEGVPAKKRKKNESNEDFLEMMENTENPLRCPVRLYEFYLSKCPESVRQRTDLFYLHPDRSCVASTPLWFSSSPLDNSTMEALLVRILTVRELQGEDRRGADEQTSDDTPFKADEDDSE